MRLVQTAPLRAVELARAARAEARRRRDRSAASTAERALGLAARELEDLPGALRHLRRAVRLAEGGADSVRAAEARMSLALALAFAGRTPRAIETVEAAAGVLRGADAARLQAQRALILQRLGAWDEALRGYGRALAVLRRRGDELWEARLLNNRGLLHAYRGDIRAAEADLRRAAGLYAGLGHELAVAEVEHNLGFVAARAGDVPAALARYDAADEWFREHGTPRAVCLVDRCELLLSVRLTDEARAAAEQAVAELAAGGAASDLAEARLMLAEAALAADDPATARTEAARAAAAFRRQARPAWAALAAYAELRARRLGGLPPSARLLASARSAAGALETAGWDAAAADARVLAGRVALALGRLDDARTELARAATGRRRGPVLVRAHAWHAEGLLRAAEGRTGAAEGAFRAGLRVLDEYGATLGATELRAHAAANGAELALAGLRIALAGGSPRRVLAWSERWRASALRIRPVRPEAGGELAAELAKLRQASAEVEEATRAGRDARRLVRRQLALEEAIRQRTRRARGDGAAAREGDSLDGLTAALGDRAFVELLRVDGTLHAVAVAGGRTRLHALGSTAAVEREAETVRFSLRRLAHPGSERALAAAAAAAAHAAGRIEELLLRPLARELADRPLVLVPTGPLHALPWAALPALRGRPVTVVPSAALWLRAARQRPGRGTVLVAGPDLPGAAAEVAALARLHPDATCLAAGAATAAATLRALDGAALAHVAAHGTFRADNPLFSCLRLDDGPLTVHDLETLAHPPRLLVLSACEGAAADVRPGDELMGLAAALLGMGTSTVVASVTTVADEGARMLMLELHRRLLAGADPAAALAAAQERVVPDEPTTAAFTCLGWA